MPSLCEKLNSNLLFKSCAAQKALDKECESYTHSIVKPLLDYVKQLTDAASQIESKDRMIKELSEKVAALQAYKDKDESYAVLFRDLQVSFKTQMDQMEARLIKTCEADKDEIRNLKSKKEIAENQLVFCHDELKKNKNFNEAALVEKNDTIEKLKKQAKSESDKLLEVERKLHQSLPNSCIPMAEYPGVHLIKVPDLPPFRVLCDSKVAGPGWTVVQQRINGKEEFFRDWVTYREGFGSFEGDFFLGLEKIYRLTKSQPHILYIHMEFFNGSTQNARYEQFGISGENDKYKLSTLENFSGSAGHDELFYHKNQMFSTFDSDNDIDKEENCAKTWHGAWWYRDCTRWYMTNCIPRRSIYHL